MNRLLAIETSSECCSVALSFDGEVLERSHHEPRRHAELILPAVSELLAEAGMSLQQLDAIAFGRGPGSFTSLRIGIGVVQGLAWGSELGVVPVSSLAALARAAAVSHAAPVGSGVVVAIDARMGEIFHARYEIDEAGSPSLRGAESLSAPHALELPSGARLIGVGNGFERYEELAALTPSLSAVSPDLWPSAPDVLSIATRWLEKNDPLPAHRAQPVYLRDDVADKPGG